MSAINDGGPAYPVPMFIRQADGMPMSAGEFFEGGNGMSLRMCLAKAAMQGMMASPECNAMGRSDIARSAFEMADEMIAMGKEGA